MDVKLHTVITSKPGCSCLLVHTVYSGCVVYNMYCVYDECTAYAVYTVLCVLYLYCVCDVYNTMCMVHVLCTYVVYCSSGNFRSRSLPQKIKHTKYVFCMTNISRYVCVFFPFQTELSTHFHYMHILIRTRITFIFVVQYLPLYRTYHFLIYFNFWTYTNFHCKV